MVGLVVVSHSRALARAAAALATEMPHGGDVPLEIAAGLDETTLGTDAMAIIDAVTAADRGDGVVVLMDLGSAVLSAGLALEMLDDDVRERVLLCPAPIVEGLVAAVVSAAGGASREEVAAEANASLEAKRSQLSETPSAGPSAGPSDGAGPGGGARPGGGAVTARVAVGNAHGLHARPAARLVTEARRFDAKVEIRNRTAGSAWAPATSLSRVATLGVLRGHEIEVRASGPEARRAVDEIVALAGRGFDEAAAAGKPPEPGKIGERDGSAGGTRGQGASAGIGIGRSWKPPATLPDLSKESPGRGSAEEWRRVEDAVAATRREIEKARAAAGGSAAAGIFGAHLLLLDDADLLEDVRSRVERGDAAPRAFADAAARTAGLFDAMSDPYLRGRAADVRAVSDQVVRVMLGTGPAEMLGDGILVAADLTPAEAVALDPRRVTGVLLAGSGPASHGAILARTRGIPMVTGAGESVLDIVDGTTIVLDGGTGEFAVDPATETEAAFRERAAAQTTRRDQAAAHAKEPAITRDGITIEVAANIGSIADARAAAQHGADLAGLVRTEFLFLDRDTAPTADEQADAYRRIAGAMGGRRITLRTLDAGGDKPLRYAAPAAPEQNPFLGVRGLRYSLRNPQLFTEQLRAIVRVARDTPVSVMFPMVSTLDELIGARRLLEAQKPPPGLRVGIMIEVPAAALKAATFTRYLDFVSIGTNDLTQYTLAAERGNPAVPADGLDPAVLRLIDAVCRHVRKPVAVCGELAADETAVPLLAALGVRELSVAPPAVPMVKAAVRRAATDSATAARALELSGPEAVRALFAETQPRA